MNHFSETKKSLFNVTYNITVFCKNFFSQVNRLIQDHAEEVGGEGSGSYMAQAKMAMLAKQFQRAEAHGVNRRW